MYTLIAISLYATVSLGTFDKDIACTWAAIVIAREHEKLSTTRVIYRCVPVTLPDYVVASPGAANAFFPPEIVANP